MLLGMGPLNWLLYKYLDDPIIGHNNIIFYMNRPRILELYLRQPPLCLLSLIQKHGSKASIQLLPRGVRHALWGKPSKFQLKRGLTSVEGMSYSRCCLGWSLSIGCYIDLCTQMYIQMLSKVPYSMFTTSSMNCIPLFILKSLPLHHFWFSGSKHSFQGSQWLHWDKDTHMDMRDVKFPLLSEM